MHSTNISAMEEVKHAVTFIVKMFDIEGDLAVLFNKNLTELLLARIAETNFSLEKPQQGSARRCVRCEVNKLDPLILEAARLSDYKPKLEKSISFCVWIDPQDVSARLGDRGSVFVIMEGPLKQRQAPSSPAHHNSKLRSSSSSSFEESSTKKLSPSVARKLQFQQQQQQQQQFQHQHHHQQQQQMYHHHHHQQQHFSQHHDMYNSRVYYQQHQPVVSYSSNSPNSTSPFGSPRSSPTNSPPPSRNQSLWVPHYRQMTVVA